MILVMALVVANVGNMPSNMIAAPTSFCYRLMSLRHFQMLMLPITRYGLW
jgi:hypothetical protein